MTLADSLKRFRQESGITQQQVADALNIHKQAWQRYESGKVVPAVTLIIHLADFFNVSIDYLVGRTDNPAINRGA